MVYTWVDGDDPAWLEKKNQFLPKSNNSNSETTGTARFEDHDELKYTLRSLEKNAHWINHIYIVTDNQTPKWLDTNNPKISIVDHKQIIPNQYLPIFNSVVIEFYIHKIPDLSEHFIYANDDAFFGRATTPEFFFDKNQEPIVRLAKQKIKGKAGNYQQRIYRMQMEIKKKYGVYYKLAPHHNADAYRISDLRATINEFQDDLEQSSHSRFRKDTDIQRSLILYHYLARGKKPYIRIGRYNGAKSILSKLKCFFSGKFLSDSKCFAIDTPNLEAKLAKYNPALFTINDEARASVEQRKEAIKLLEKLFPKKSNFEL